MWMIIDQSSTGAPPRISESPSLWPSTHETSHAPEAKRVHGMAKDMYIYGIRAAECCDERFRLHLQQLSRAMAEFIDTQAARSTLWICYPAHAYTFATEWSAYRCNSIRTLQVAFLIMMRSHACLYEAPLRKGIRRETSRQITIPPEGRRTSVRKWHMSPSPYLRAEGNCLTPLRVA